MALPRWWRSDSSVNEWVLATVWNWLCHRVHSVTAPNTEPKMIASLNTEDVASFVTGLEGEQRQRTPDDSNVMATAVTRFWKKNADLVTQTFNNAFTSPRMSVKAGEEGSVSIAGGVRLRKRHLMLNSLLQLKNACRCGKRRFMSGNDASCVLPCSYSVYGWFSKICALMN